VVELEKINFADVLYVAQNMRERDREEINLCRWDDDDFERLAEDCMSNTVFGWLAKAGGEPVAVLGAVPARPGVWGAYLFATDRWPEVSSTMSKVARRQFLPVLRTAGAHRVECHSMEGYDTIHKWIEWCGLRREAEVPGFGKDGRKFIRFAKVWNS